jgi:hypothetical protein
MSVPGVASRAWAVRIVWRSNDNLNQRLDRYFQPQPIGVVNKMG